MTTILLATLANAAAASAPAASPADYHIGAGDILQVEVYGEDIGGKFVVGSNGEIRFPFCDLVPLGQLTVFEAEQSLKTCLSDGYINNPQVSVRIDEYRSHRVEVLGAVGKPGPYYLQGETTLRAVIGQAGGIQADKTTGRVVVTRQGGERLVVLETEVDGAGGDLRLERGDVVSVEEGAVVYVGGEVEKPGAVNFTDGLTVTQALMRAGGPTGIARLRGAYLLREGEDDRISVNLRRMLRGKDADLVMRPGDRLVIQESPL
ncbi:MAG: polysaccharide biosynthesis/export family protein [Myxococcota bacterium]